MLITSICTPMCSPITSPRCSMITSWEYIAGPFYSITTTCHDEHQSMISYHVLNFEILMSTKINYWPFQMTKHARITFPGDKACQNYLAILSDKVHQKVGRDAINIYKGHSNKPSTDQEHLEDSRSVQNIRSNLHPFSYKCRQSMCAKLITGHMA